MLMIFCQRTSSAESWQIPAMAAIRLAFPPDSTMLSNFEVNRPPFRCTRRLSPALTYDILISMQSFYKFGL